MLYAAADARAQSASAQRSTGALSQACRRPCNWRALPDRPAGRLCLRPRSADVEQTGWGRALLCARASGVRGDQRLAACAGPRAAAVEPCTVARRRRALALDGGAWVLRALVARRLAVLEAGGRVLRPWQETVERRREPRLGIAGVERPESSRPVARESSASGDSALAGVARRGTRRRPRSRGRRLRRPRRHDPDCGLRRPALAQPTRRCAVGR